MWAAAGYVELVRLSDAGLKQCTRSALLHFNRAVALDHMERRAEAEAAYERSLALDPTLAYAHFNLAELHQEAGDERGALRHCSAYRRLQLSAGLASRNSERMDTARRSLLGRLQRDLNRR